MDGEEKTDELRALANWKGEDEAPNLVEITTFIREDQAFALELLESTRRLRLGANFDQAALIQEALDLLIEKHIVAIDLRKGKMFKQPDSAT
jgi:hypothetical protein